MDDDYCGKWTETTVTEELDQAIIEMRTAVGNAFGIGLAHALSAVVAEVVSNAYRKHEGKPEKDIEAIVHHLATKFGVTLGNYDYDDRTGKIKLPSEETLNS